MQFSASNIRVEHLGCALIFNISLSYVISGYNPIFDESFEFQINLPELALVRFAVLDDDYIGDEFIGQYTIPFECMQTGKCRRNKTNKHQYSDLLLTSINDRDNIICNT